MSQAKLVVESLFNLAGVKVNGDNPWDIKIHNADFYKRVLKDGSLGLGESYMAGWWDCDSLDQFFYKILSAELDKKVRGNLRFLFFYLSNLIFNQQKKGWQSDQVGKEHYDIGNDLYKYMLGPSMAYTGGYWHAHGQVAKDLDTAQRAKLDLVCRKLNLKRGQTVLDIGGGWGSFGKFAALNYGVSVTIVNNSREQCALGQDLCRGLPVEFRLQDYRDIRGRYDHIVSLGMFEHVGYKNYPTFMRIAADCLKDGGLFLLHTIGGNHSVKATDPWLEKYIFPNSMLPSIAQIGAAIEDLFVMEDWHNFGKDYDLTLMAWFNNFDQHWAELRTLLAKAVFDDRFYRMWKYYLLSCAGSFRTRQIQLWQIVLSKQGVPGGYQSIR
jgi:cyclopropane-fatty-acyl-phospholipid synthase